MWGAAYTKSKESPRHACLSGLEGHGEAGGQMDGTVNKRKETKDEKR